MPGREEQSEGHLGLDTQPRGSRVLGGQAGWASPQGTGQGLPRLRGGGRKGEREVTCDIHQEADRVTPADLERSWWRVGLIEREEERRQAAGCKQ